MLQREFKTMVKLISASSNECLNKTREMLTDKNVMCVFVLMLYGHQTILCFQFQTPVMDFLHIHQLFSNILEFIIFFSSHSLE